MRRPLFGRALRRDFSATDRGEGSHIAAAARRLWRPTFSIMVAAIMCGCATARDGSSYASLSQKVGPPKAGTARVVVMREKGFAGLIDAGWVVQVDGTPMAGLKTGTFVYRD